MTRLSLTLLGTLQITLDGEPVTGFESDKVRALLIYLALEADRLHRREALAEMFWPDRPEGGARNSLRQALANLRKAIGDREADPPFLCITRGEIQFNPDSSQWVDAVACSALLNACQTHAHHRVETCEPCIGRLREAVALYQGPLLEQFYLGDSATFEEWALVRREGLQRQVMMALRHLTAHHEQRGEYRQARQFAWRQVKLEPWNETAQRELMRTLALSGQRSAALKQYQACRRVLADELGVEPAKQTTELVAQIRDGEYDPPGFSHKKRSAEITGPSRSQPLKLLALAMLFALILVLSLGLFVGSLDRNSKTGTVSKNPSTPLPTIIHATRAIATGPHPDNTPTTVYPFTGQKDIPWTEYQALVALYNETKGSGWKDSSDWLSDSTPCSWFGVTCRGRSVSELNFPDNGLSGTIPPEISQLTHLRVLNLGSNQLRGSIPPELGSLSYLESLILAGNSDLSGTIPPELGDLDKIKTLVLSNYEGGTQLSGSIPPELGNLRRLVQLELSYSLVSGPIPPELGNLTNLMALDLSFNLLSGPIPSEMGNLVNLRYLSLHDNGQLSGAIPSELGNLVKLELLILSNDDGGTQLSGPIPPELGNLRRLKQLAIANSLVSGPIRPELGNLTNLTYLDLAKNPLSGPLPPELGNLVNLRTLAVGEGTNELKGPLPLSLMNLKKLEYFTYSTNTDLCEPPDAAFQEWLNGIPELFDTRVLCQREK